MTEIAVPEYPMPRTLSETELDTVAVRSHTGQAAPEELQAIGGGHRAIAPERCDSYRNSSLPLRNSRRTRKTSNRESFGSFDGSQKRAKVAPQNSSDFLQR
jgi:hypothetical protein